MTKRHVTEILLLVLLERWLVRAVLLESRQCLKTLLMCEQRPTFVKR